MIVVIRQVKRLATVMEERVVLSSTFTGMEILWAFYEWQAHKIDDTSILRIVYSEFRDKALSPTFHCIKW